MPFFNETSRIYDPAEIDFMSGCFTSATERLKERGQSCDAYELAASIFTLFDSGLRDEPYIVELAARLAHTKYKKRLRSKFTINWQSDQNENNETSPSEQPA